MSRVNKVLNAILLLLVAVCISACSTNTEEDTESILTHFSDIKTGFQQADASLYTQGDLLISLPKAVKPKLPLVLIFSGMYYATPKYMMDNTPVDFFQQAIVVFAPCRNVGGKGFEAARVQYERFLDKQGIGIKKLSVCGFSGGGPDALEADDEKLVFIGLIDPNPLLPKRQKELPRHVILSFNKANWSNVKFDESTTTHEAFDRLTAWARKKGVRIEENKVKHEWFTKYFLYKYRKKLLS